MENVIDVEVTKQSFMKRTFKFFSDCINAAVYKTTQWIKLLLLGVVTVGCFWYGIGFYFPGTIPTIEEVFNSSGTSHLMVFSDGKGTITKSWGLFGQPQVQVESDGVVEMNHYANGSFDGWFMTTDGSVIQIEGNAKYAKSITLDGDVGRNTATCDGIVSSWVTYIEDGKVKVKDYNIKIDLEPFQD